MSTLNEIISDTALRQHVDSLSAATLLVLSFHTPWAAPCAQMRTILSTLATLYPVTSPPVVSFISINAEELPDISERYDVSAVPFLVLQRGDEVLESISGSDPIRVREAIEKYAGVTNPSTETGPTKATLPPPLTATPREQLSSHALATETPATSSLGAATNGTANNTTTTTTTAAPALSIASPEETKEALFARLAELVKAASVMLFMKGTPSAPQCGFSRQLVSILREKNVKYGFFNILADEDVRQGLKEFADWPTFPQLWVQGELVGGLDIVSFSSFLPFFFFLFRQRRFFFHTTLLYPRLIELK
jgi:Grx4 family monothiol glutaredoxin